jgi:hypothetical protein
LFSSSRFLEAKPRRKRKKLKEYCLLRHPEILRRASTAQEGF